ncbi:MAG: GNAT family N-acetyltransferase [Phycisphaerales bacterium]
MSDATTAARIRLARPEDAPALAAIYNHAVLETTATFDTEPKDAAERQRWLAAHDAAHPVTVAEVDGRVVGWASLTRWSDRCAYDSTAETSFYVEPASQGRGIGRALLTDLVARARAAGLHALLARITVGSEASVRLHRALGFQPVGTLREVGRKFGKLLDVEMLQLVLEPGDAREAREYAPYYERYVSQVPPGEVIGILEREGERTRATLARIGEGSSLTLHPPYTWTARQVVGHLSDAERVFSYRLLRIARGDATPLPGFDENAYMAVADFDRIPLATLAQEFAQVRAATLSLLRGLAPEAWPRRGTASGGPLTVRAAAAIIAGHEQHHMAIVRRRWGVE